MTVDDAAHFRAVVREVLAEMGHEVDLRPQSVVTDDGREWGLWNVAAVAYNDEQGRPAWPGVVRGHFARLFAAEAANVDDLSDESFFAALRMRIVEVSALPPFGPGEFDHALPWVDGLVRLPVVDLPHTVATVTRSALMARGPLAACLDRASANTAALVATETLEVERVEHDGRWFTCVLGDSLFTASLALFLPDLVRRLQPGADLSMGVVFAVPYRHQVDFRVVDGRSAALDALLLIPRFAALGFSDSPGPLSPHTYLWLDGEVTRLTHHDGGSLTVSPGAHLEALLTEDD